MVVASIYLDGSADEIALAIDEATLSCDEAWTHARRVLVEVFCVPAAEVVEMRSGWTRTLLLAGKKVYEQSAEHWPEKIIIFAHWLFRAHHDFKL